MVVYGGLMFRSVGRNEEYTQSFSQEKCFEQTAWEAYGMVV